jgi:hypothetical protein
VGTAEQHLRRVGAVTLVADGALAGAVLSGARLEVHIRPLLLREQRWGARDEAQVLRKCEGCARAVGWRRALCRPWQPHCKRA